MPGFNIFRLRNTHSRLVRMIMTFTLGGSLIFATTSCSSPGNSRDSMKSKETSETDQAFQAAATAAETEEAVQLVKTGTTIEALNASEDIHVNQIGYLNKARKVAIISGIHRVFAVVDNSTGKAVLSRETQGSIQDPSSGDTVCHADFSELTSAGEYYIAVPGLGKSQPFKIGDGSIYSGVGDALVKALYYQRCGMNLETEYAGDYSHKACHTAKAKLYGNDTAELEVTGGWHDAGDYGRYVVPAAVTAAGMMLSWELFPEGMKDKLNIPDGPGKLPDVLEEVRYGLEWMLKMQDAKTGGVYHKATGKNFPGMILMPEDDVDQIYVLPVSATATGDFAATTAMAARVYREFDRSFSDRCLKASLRAWDWLEKNPDFVEFKNPEDVRSGEYGDGSGNDEICWASAELFRVTGEEKFNSYFKEHFNTGSFELGWADVNGFGAIAYMFADTGKADAAKAGEMKESWIRKAEELVEVAQKDGYLLAMQKQDYIWGSNMLVANHAVHLIIADKLGKNEKFAAAAMDCIHYLLGANSLNQSYITGFGSKQPMNPHHRPSYSDKPEAPVPGLVVGGPDAGLQDDIARAKLKGKAPAKCYIDNVNSYSTNEVATYWNSPAIFAFAWLRTQ